MNTVWRTQKGDEWRYERRGIEAFADFDSNESLLSIRHAHSKNHTLTQNQLLKLLRDTKSSFTDTNINLNVASSEHELATIIQALSNKGLITSQGTAHQGSTTYQIISVANKKWWSLC